jgi:Ni/Co efflux regulator RcnB
MKKLLIPALLAATFAATMAHADGANTPGLDQRQENQQRRIDQGVESGALNANEAARLEGQQNRVQRAEDRAKSDGVVTGKERAALHHRQDHTSRTIARKKHNAR